MRGTVVVRCPGPSDAPVLAAVARATTGRSGQSISPAPKSPGRARYTGRASIGADSVSVIPPLLARLPREAPVWARAGFGIALVLLVLGGGFLVERWRFGRTDADALALLERNVRREVAGRAARLRTLARLIADNTQIVATLAQPGLPGDEAFAVIDRLAGPGAPTDLSVTVNGPDGQVVAWRGRPASLPPQRLNGPATVFIAPGPTGLRLVHVEPVTQAKTGRRLGAVSAEQVIGAFPGGAGTAGDALLEASPVSVSVYLRAVPVTPPSGLATFGVAAAGGEPLFTAAVPLGDLGLAREALRAEVSGIVALCFALTLAALAVGFTGHGAPGGYRSPLAAAGLIVAARAVLWAGLPSSWREGVSTTMPPAQSAGGSDLDLLLTALMALGLVAVAFDVAERWRLARRARRRTVITAVDFFTYAGTQAVASLLACWLVLGFEWVLRTRVLAPGYFGLDLIFLPLDLSRAMRFTGLVLSHVAVCWTAVILLRVALTPWRPGASSKAFALLTLSIWLAAASILLATVPGTSEVSRVAVLLVVGLAGAGAWRWRHGLAWFHHGSQGRRLAALCAAVVVPTLALQPSLAFVIERAREDTVSTRFVAQVMHHPAELQATLAESLRQIDAMPALAELVSTLPSTAGIIGTEAAFSVWQQTALARRRLTSAIELYGFDGRLVSRFALNFPEYASLNQHWQNDACEWGEVFGEAAPFGAEERRMLHAERAVCDAANRPRGAIVVHVMLDYGALPFLSTQSPYFALFRPAQLPAAPAEELPGTDVSLTVYGWGRTPIYTSTARAWAIPQEVFERIYRSREPFWARIDAAGRRERVLFANDRYGIYAVGFPEITWFGLCVRLAELAAFGALTFVVLYLLASLVWRIVWPRPGPVVYLAREIRGSFSRKLFLAFVAAAVVPVLVLALSIRVFVASRLRAEVEAEAARTAAVAQRVIQETLATQRRDEVTPTALTDDVMVWISRVIDQDVNIFVGTQVAATSERDLFASGLLPTRVPGDVYRAVVLQRLPSYVTEDRIGGLRYLMAAAPVRTGDADAILTVPLALRQREIEREIDDLDRGVVLGVVVFVLVGAGVGYWLAQRIADPVARLTRASQRIASGELSARVFVRTADELQRLVESFNSMAHELERQRAQLEHTNRLEAWAEMARQVAHDIKNPLTPIQLSAEHLQRVHRDRGEPLSPVLDRCVDVILGQVRLLRRISSEFSSFAATPTVRPEPTSPAPLLQEIVEHYRLGLEGRIDVQAEIAGDLPVVLVDHVLLGRAITNVIENALQAMPAAGTLHVAASVDADRELVIAIRDTGVGMDAEDAARAFDPSFSTKATGTGLGLPIAKRNVELHGGRVSVTSASGSGTTVTFRFPLERLRPPAA